MGLMHCPLCMGLAVLSAVRFSAHALLIWRRYGSGAAATDHAAPATAAQSGSGLAAA